MVTTYLKLWRSSGDELDNSVIADITFRLQAVESTAQALSTFNSEDLVQIRSNLTRDYLEFFDSCFHIGSEKRAIDYYLQNEPDSNECRMLHDFNYRTTNMVDESGFGNHAILTGGRPKIKHYNESEPAYSLHFNGTTDKVVVTQHADFNLSVFTFSFWIYPESQAGAKKVLMDRGAISSWVNGAYTLYRDTNDNIVFECQNGTGTKKLVSSDIISLKGLNRWYNVIVRYDGALLSIIVYADDETIDTDSIAQSGSFSLAADLTFGNTAKGYLDEIMFYNEYLTDTEVSVLHALEDSLLNVRISGLILWLGFNDKYFSENFHTGKTRDLSNFHTGVITGATFSNTTATNLATFKPRDFISDIRRGFKFEDDKFIHMHIPENNIDLKLKDKTSGELTFDFELLLKDCKQMNSWNQRILEKWDHVEAETKHGYSIQLDSLNYLLIGAYWNDTRKSIKSLAPLPLDLITRLQVCIDIDELILSSTDTTCLKMGIDGFWVSSNATTDDMQLPDGVNPSNSTDFRIGKSHVERGYYSGNNMLFSLRNYKRVLNDLEVLSLATNHDTIFEIPLGRIAVMDLLPLLEESPFYRKLVDKITVNKGTLDHFTTSSFDTVPTVRFFDRIPIPSTDSPLDVFRTKGITTTTGYSLSIASGQWVELPLLREINDHFTLLFFVKFVSADAEWGTVISQLDGLQNGNAFSMKGTRLRYTGQFEDNQENWDDYRTTIPDCTNTWISCGFTYNGDKHRFRLVYNGKIIAQWGRGGNIQHGNTKARIGQYDNGNRILTGKLWHLYSWRSEMNESELMEYHMTGDIVTGKSRFFQYNFNKDLLDSSEQKFHGKNKGATFSSSDLPTL